MLPTNGEIMRLKNCFKANELDKKKQLVLIEKKFWEEIKQNIKEKTQTTRKNSSQKEKEI